MNKWTRRGLITTGVVATGALVVGVAIRPGHRAPKIRDLVAADDEVLVDVWLKITPENEVVAIVPHAEMGQGAHTTLAMMLADELDADWNKVSVMEAPADGEYANYTLGRGFLFSGVDIPSVLIGTVDGIFLTATKALDLQITGGSSSVRATGVVGMRMAGASARQMLARAAADEWDVSIEELELANSEIKHAGSGRVATYAQFAAAAAEMAPDLDPKLKDESEFRIMGRSVPRLDVPAKVDGSANFGIDAEVEGMRYATIKKSPVFGGSVASVGTSAALAVRGVEQVVNLGDAVAVVADGYWPARKGLAALDIRWTETPHDPLDSEAIFAQFDRDLGRSDIDINEDRVMGEVDAAFAASSDRIDADYRVPYLAHAAMEPLNCTVRFEQGLCEVWTGSQNPLGVRASVAGVLEIDPEFVTVHNQYLGGGFGRRAFGDFADQAAQIVKQVGGAVKLIWSREEDIAQDMYRPAVTSRFSAALGADGFPTVWTNRYVDKHEPAEAPLIPYDVANQRIDWIASPTHVPFGPWRSVDHSQHGFFTESFIDELAIKAEADPFEYRRALLRNASRERRVLEAAAAAGRWGRWQGPGKGQGIALHTSFGTIVAQVVDVTVEAGKVKVDHIACAVDPGYAVHPDGLIAQMESGIVYGLTAALYGEISIGNGRVKESNFHDYPMLRIDEMPVIETVVINGGGTLGGAGEPGTTAIAPALANAIYQATGTRIRQLPASKYDLDFRIEETA